MYVKVFDIEPLHGRRKERKPLGLGERIKAGTPANLVILKIIFLAVKRCTITVKMLEYRWPLTYHVWTQDFSAQRGCESRTRSVEAGLRIMKLDLFLG